MMYRTTLASLKGAALALITCLFALTLACGLLGCGASSTDAAGASAASYATSTQLAASDADGATASDGAASGSVSSTTLAVEESGTYTSKDEVALYIHTYGHLPSNFISKTKARKAGWVSSEGNLDEVCPGMSIGGSTFYNDDGLLPEADGRTWKECDINYTGGYRGSERIVFSNDGLIYYTNDHYQTFEQLY